MCDPSVVLTETDISVLGARDFADVARIYLSNIREFGTCQSDP
jgi:hypothetical protein